MRTLLQITFILISIVLQACVDGDTIIVDDTCGASKDVLKQMREVFAEHCEDEDTGFCRDFDLVIAAHMALTDVECK